jgi:hypothetical protein
MLVYHDTDGNITLTLKGPKHLAPQGDFIEVDDATVIDPISAYKIENGAVVLKTIEPRRKSAILAVNKRIERERTVYTTDISGQEMIYREKENEARLYVTLDPEPATLEDFPFIAQEVGKTGDTAYEVAQVYLNLAAQWKQIGSALEGLRIYAINQIRSATTEQEIDQALDSFEGEIDALGPS